MLKQTGRDGYIYAKNLKNDKLLIKIGIQTLGKLNICISTETKIAGTMEAPTKKKKKKFTRVINKGKRQAITDLDADTGKDTRKVQS